ncbi:MAG: PAS domain-containing protein, partial [Gammaproteobacteria bacterium]|nr:PAS domain-containing protein [Gammaproteobacteria bacterium]
MKINDPVTGNEIPFPETGILVSQTDLRGVITYANQAFVDISGFSRSELIGRSHNIVRHPDMPPEAFEDLWRTVKAGRPWTGLVKNRARNGDHYWVKANVTPLREGGRVTGYLSVRTRPERHEVDAAERLYAAVRRGAARLGPKGPTRWLGALSTLRIRTLLGGTVFATLGVLGAVAGMVAAGAHPHSIYALLGLTGLTTLVLGLSLTAYVTRPLAYAQRKLAQVAEGNYFDWVDTRRRDEVGELLQAIKATQIKLGFEVMDARERADAATRLKTALD